MTIEEALPHTLRSIAGRVEAEGCRVEAYDLRGLAQSIEDGSYAATMAASVPASPELEDQVENIRRASA